MRLDSFFTGTRQKRFEKQVRPHLSVLYQYACRLCGQPDDAEDLVQDLLINLYHKDIDLGALRQPKTWLLKSLYHQFIDFTRKQKRNPSVPNYEDETETLNQQSDIAHGPGQALEQARLGERLESALNQLPVEQKMLILLHDVEGHTLVEIAEIMDTPLGTLKSRLHRTRKSLRTILQREPFREIRRVNL
jgi:RNA polymerase sigma-70 factor (ECF subfamily)